MQPQILLFRRTNSVLSKIERTKTFPIWGLLYGGSSSTKDDGIPLRTVLDNIFDITNVIIIPSIMTKTTDNADKIDDQIPSALPAMNIEEIVIKNGNLPVTRNKIVSKYSN